jgi:inward rectifier potassium channel
VLDDGIVVVGAASHPLRDAYHSLLRMRWPTFVLSIALLFLGANGIFACAYTLTGGIAGVHEGSALDAFFFSVQTMATIGYGAMYPVTTAAHLVVVAEAVTSVMITALSTGMVFARFSQTTGMLVFTSKICISPMDGVPTIMLRIGNDRASLVYEATVRLVATRTVTTQEGVKFYRMVDLVLVRDRTPALARSWTVMHRLDEASPLRGLTPKQCDDDEIEILVSVAGTDDTSLQPVHGRRRYEARDILWGARPADVLSERADGRLQLDVRQFDVFVATKATVAFPYPADGR